MEYCLKIHINILNGLFLVLYNSQVINIFYYPGYYHINTALRNEEINKAFKYL